MYFKQIELQGFKSFADRTVIQLEPGTTAIVGPNGCGKSNILDAMRWALGEQSAKALRGSHMQDVIFNGSEHRPATGMAEVVLTFDNATGRLPIDFAEVTVSRRVYRSGESEYLLNKAPCRLRDIVELFMDTGVGTNAYSLIGQGKIDMVLSSKPEDRRFLFEEAAGIIKYKTRKRVAIRKLDSAEQNLLRLGDIIAEVQRQMRNLKRQVNAAIRHRELTSVLKELEVRNAWLRYNELSGQIDDLRERFKTAQNAYEKASAETSKEEARLEELNIKRVETERTLMARRDGEHQIDSEMEKLESQIALLRRDIEYGQEQQATAHEEQKEFASRAENAQSTEGESDEKASALRQELKDVEDAIAAKQEAWNAAQARVAEADASLEAMRQRALETINTRNRTQTEIETLGASLSSIDGQLANLTGRHEKHATRHEALTARHQEVHGKHSAAQKAFTEKVALRQAQQAERAENVQRLETLNKEWQTLREQKSSQEARLASLRELRDSYEGFATGVRAVMMAKQRNMGNIQGVIGPVGDLISTEKSYEQAVEAALGGNINNIVVNQADDAKSAINFLKEHRAGRVTFLPLDTIRPSSHDDSDTLRGLPGVVGKAINFVQCEARIMPALEYLLYNTVIVETIDDAIRIARSERRFPRLVTLEGEVVSSAGAVTGGRTKHETRGLLGRSAEIEELETKTSAAEKKINALSRDALALTEKATALAESIKALESEENTLRQETGELGVALAEVNTELKSITQDAEQLAEQRNELAARRQELEARRASAQERFASMDDDDAALERDTIAAQDNAAQARQAFAAAGDELTELRVRLASLSQHVDEAERNKVREQRAREEALREAQRRVELVERLQVREKELEASIADQVERIKALSETREDAHGKVLEAQQEQDRLLKETDKVTAALKTLRVQTNSTQKEVHSLELDLSHKEDQIGFFQERIAADYGLALGSLSEKEVGTDEYDEDEREKLIADNRKELQKLGTVNLMAIDEYEALEKRNEFLTTQEEDLRKAKETLLSVVGKIDATIKEMFLETFNLIGENFKNFFRRLFNGGQARIYLLDEDDPLESGIEIEARPPGKKPQVISLLSGGEQAMTAIALLFSIFSAKPSPFCVLDEVDAPLDDANIGRFLGLVDEFTDRSQFIIITHSKQTMSHVDALFGVTQQERGVSQMVSVKFDEVRDADFAA